MFESSVISCLGKLSYKIVGCIKVFHSFMSESCIRWCAVVYDEILMRSFLFALLHLVFFPRNQPYMLILMGVLIIYQVWLWKLYLILANIALVMTTSISFLSPSSIQNLYVLMLEVLCWQGRQLDVLCQFLMFRLYIVLHPSQHHLSAFKAFAGQTMY